MEAALQGLGNFIDGVKITFCRRPARRGQIHPPPPLPAAQVQTVIPQKRGSFLKVKEQRLGFVALGCMAAGFQDTPPWDTSAMVAHDGTDLARAS